VKLQTPLTYVGAPVTPGVPTTQWITFRPSADGLRVETPGVNYDDGLLVSDADLPKFAAELVNFLKEL
jgi:hypothetical protein